MTDLKFAILDFIYNSQDHKCSEYTLLSQKLDSYIKVHIALRDMLKASSPYLVRCVDESTFELTEHGIEVYELEKEKRKNHSEQQRQQSFQNKIAVASLLISAISFIGGIIVEYRVNVVDWLISLF